MAPPLPVRTGIRAASCSGVIPASLSERQLAGLRAEPPAIIVDSEAANPHWSGDDDFLRPPPPGAAGGRDLDILEPFRAFVRERYALVAEIEGRKVYRLT